MLIYENVKINNISYIRIISDTNYFLKIKGKENLLNEVLYLPEEKVQVEETNILIEEEIEN
jgi:hypothetical protein